MTDEIKRGDRVRVVFEGSEIFEEGTELTMYVVGLDPVLVGHYDIGPRTSIVFGPDSYKSVEKVEQ